MDVDSAYVDDLLGTLRRIPLQARNFSVAITDVPCRFGIPAALLIEMVSLGFPAEHINGRLYFEVADLLNLSFRARVGINYRTIRRFWPPALKSITEGRDLSYELNYVARCPSPGHEDCRFGVLTPSGTVVEVEGANVHSASVYSTIITLPGRFPDLSTEARGLVDTIERYELTWLPRSLQLDTAFMSETGLANCLGASMILVSEGRRRGADVRSSFGLLASPPYAGIHFWADVRIEQTWVSIDPLTIGAMLRWDVLDPHVWDTYRPLGGILCRLAERRLPIVTHAGKELSPLFPIRRAS